MLDINIPNLSVALHWHNPPTSWDWSDDKLTIKASASTDWFIDPQDAYNLHNAPALLFSATNPCMLSAKVTVEYAAKYDAGALVVYESPLSWGKFALELSPRGELTVVSVVTKGTSDDCNAFPVTGPAYLRLAKLEQAYAFHFSQDGKFWDLIRYFKLEDHKNTQMGFLAQSPTRNECTVHFAEIHYELRLLSDIRSGA